MPVFTPYNELRIPDIDNDIKILCEEFRKYNYIDPSKYERYGVKRGLRNPDGSGVVAGLTQICNVHGYVLNEGEKSPIDGELIYRGYDIRDLVQGVIDEDRFGYEEVIWLLLFGALPTADQIEMFKSVIAKYRELPHEFAENVIMKAASPNIMNKLAQSVLALYAYDEHAEDLSLENVMRQCIELIAMIPTIMVTAYQVKRRVYDHKSMYFHPTKPEQSIAESILRTLRSDKKFTREEAKLLDICLMLHAEHGGGNNSTFACRVLSSTGTDTYSAISGAIGSLKGPRHGGANIKAVEMIEAAKLGIKNWKDDDEVEQFLEKLLRREAGDHSGLIYGMGHAIYTKSDPRAVILKANAKALAYDRDLGDEFELIEAIERLTPQAYAKVRGEQKVMCANVDLYSGLVYKILRIPQEMYTPLFAVSRMAGWCAHRIEELTSGGKIMRPAYKAICKPVSYVPLSERENGK